MSQPADTAIGWRAVLGLAASYLATTVLTQARFMGDSVDYVIEASRPIAPDWEFGHLWWVPLGRALGHAAQPLLAAVGVSDHRVTLVLTFLAVNWIAGLACVLLLAATARRLGASAWAAVAAAVALLFAQAFLNFAQTGSSYVPGLACLMLALYLVARTHGEPGLAALGAGAAFGAAVCFWFPFVLAGLAFLLMPLLFPVPARGRFLVVAGLAAGAALVLVLAYGTAAVSLGIHDMAGLRAWVARSAHGVRTGGVARAALGLARSFVFIGDDGLLMKRFLLRDPYNPVSLVGLALSSLWKVALFYLTVVAVATGLIGRPEGRRLGVVLSAAAVPVVAFGVFWQGGDMERYLPLYPFLFLALAGMWSDSAIAGPCRWLAMGFFVLAALLNAAAHSRWAVGAYCDGLKHRVADLRDRLPPGSRIVVVRDRLMLLPRDFPLEDTRTLPVTEVAVPGLAGTPAWRADFARLVHQTWADGGQVWFTRWLLAPRPHPDSTWAEGDDPRLQWPDVPAFFRPFETDGEAGGEDGLVRLARSKTNEGLLVRHLSP